MKFFLMIHQFSQINKTLLRRHVFNSINNINKLATRSATANIPVVTTLHHRRHCVNTALPTNTPTSTADMPRNVEIKAKVTDLEDLKRRAKLLAGNDGTLIEQEDTFFNVSNGRLKLRNVKGEGAVLIQYNRPDQEGPKLSDYHLATVNDVQAMKIVLTEALGLKGVVKKTRLLVILDQTRIHLDDVHGLGQFMEFEVVLRDDQSVEDGQKIAENLMAKLNIQSSDLLDSAYMDMILKNK